MKFSYYPGCSLDSTAKEFDMSVHAVCKELDVELKEIPDWNLSLIHISEHTRPY